MSVNWRRLCCALCGAGTLSCAAVARGATTSWTGAAGNNLWGDPLNWDHGVPAADTDAAIEAAAGTLIDLGGVTRRAASVLGGGGFTLVNGTLTTPAAIAHTGIQADGLPGFTIACGLTTDGGLLRIQGSNATFPVVTVTGPITGGAAVAFDGRSAGVHTYTGRTIVSTYLDLSGGRIAASPAIEVRPGAAIRLGAGPDQVGAGVLELHGGTLQVPAPAAGAPPVRAGGVRLAGGASQMQLFGNLSAPTLSRDAGATLRLNTASSTPGLLMLDAPPAGLAGSGTARDRLPVAPWATSRTNNPFAPEVFLAYDAGALRPLFEYATEWFDGANVRLSPAGTSGRGADVSVNTLSMPRGSSLVLSDGATLTLAGGGLLSDAAPVSGNGSLALPAGGGVVHAVATDGSASRIAVPVTGGPLTKAGPAPLELTRANTYASGTIVVEGRIVVAAPGALGAGPVRLGGDGTGLTVGFAGAVVANDLLIDAGLPATLTIPDGATTTWSGRIGGSGQAQVVGNGTLRLTGPADPAAGAYALSVTTGARLVVDGELAGPDSVVTGGGNGVFGHGVIRGTLSGSGDVSPGDPGGATGRLTVGRVDLSGIRLVLDLAGPSPADGYDQLAVLDALVLRAPDDMFGSLLTLAPASGFAPAAGQTFEILDNRFAGPVQGTFDYFTATGRFALPEGAIVSADGTTFRISYLGGDGNDVTLTVVPEPAGLALVGMMAVLLRRVRRR